MKKTRSALSTFTIILVIFFTVATANNNIDKAKAEETDTVLQITPCNCTVENISEAFSLNLTITNVTDLYGWEVKICYQNTVIECLHVTEGPFLESGGDTFWIAIINNTYSPTHGRVHMGCSLMGMISGVNGSGVLATIDFQTICGGNTTLHLADTKLLDSSRPQHDPIPHTSTDGFVHVTEFHDIAVTNVLTSKTIIGQGFSMNITVTAENKGNRADTFNVTVYANSTIIGLKTVSNLAPNSQANVTFTWNTGGFSKGNDTISAYAHPLSGEIDTSLNNFTDGWVIVTIPGDVDGDFDVDLYDAVALLARYGAKEDDPNYHPNCDINGNGQIFLYDAVILLSHYGEKDR